MLPSAVLFFLASRADKTKGNCLAACKIRTVAFLITCQMLTRFASKLNDYFAIHKPKCGRGGC
jgi:hypothetical protein